MGVIPSIAEKRPKTKQTNKQKPFLVSFHLKSEFITEPFHESSTTYSGFHNTTALSYAEWKVCHLLYSYFEPVHYPVWIALTVFSDSQNNPEWLFPLISFSYCGKVSEMATEKKKVCFVVLEVLSVTS